MRLLCAAQWILNAWFVPSHTAFSIGPCAFLIDHFREYIQFCVRQRQLQCVDGAIGITMRH